MTKTLTFFFILIMMANLLWCDLLDCYKKGRINISGVDNFGKNNDWEDYFFDPVKWVMITPGPDYHIYVANSRQNAILKFDNHGKYLKKFGRKGLGPGDVNNPKNMSLLDHKYIVICDFLAHRRITIWDLEGNFIDVVRTSRSPYNATAVKNNKIAFWTYSQNSSPENGYKSKSQIILKDIKTRKEKVIREITLLDRSDIILGKSISTNLGNFFGEVFLFQTKDGNLAVGVSNNPEINIYSSDGEKIHAFNLNIRPIAVNGQYIDKFKATAIAKVKKELKETSNETLKWWYKQDLIAFPKFDFSKIFTKYLPLYKEILVDADGNFLVFKYSDCLEDCKINFQVYSPKGEFICETELDTGIYDIEIDSRFKILSFTKDGIIGYAMEKGDEEEIYRLFKSNY